MGPIPYKPGDLVICRHPDRTWLRRSRVYRVAEVRRDRHRGDELAVCGGIGLWFADWRFDAYQK